MLKTIIPSAALFMMSVSQGYSLSCSEFDRLMNEHDKISDIYHSDKPRRVQCEYRIKAINISNSLKAYKIFHEKSCESANSIVYKYVASDRAIAKQKSYYSLFCTKEKMEAY